MTSKLFGVVGTTFFTTVNMSTYYAIEVSCRIIPLFRQALTVGFAANAWIALCYTFNNLLYFDALSAISAVAYQVISQSKTVFTAALMYFLKFCSLYTTSIALPPKT